MPHRYPTHTLSTCSILSDRHGNNKFRFLTSFGMTRWSVVKPLTFRCPNRHSVHETAEAILYEAKEAQYQQNGSKPNVYNCVQNALLRVTELCLTPLWTLFLVSLRHYDLSRSSARTVTYRRTHEHGYGAETEKEIRADLNSNHHPCAVLLRPRTWLLMFFY